MADHQELLDDLVYFARAGELDDLKEVKALPENFVEKDDTGKTALHMASANNHVGRFRNAPTHLNNNSEMDRHCEIYCRATLYIGRQEAHRINQYQE